MKGAVCFEQVHYDVDRLRAELALVEEGLWHEHSAKQYHTGGWKAVPLISAGGRMDADALWPGEHYQKTVVLEQCPYLNQIIDSFACPKHRVRLMRMHPGTVIKPHTDARSGWAWGFARMHVPIVTHEQVHFESEGRRLPMKPGELWYVNTERVHSVRNESPIARVHLVLDLEVNDFLRDFFPRESRRERLGNLAIRTRDRASEARGVAIRQAKRIGTFVYVYSGAHAFYRLSGLKKLRNKLKAES